MKRIFVFALASLCLVQAQALDRSIIDNAFKKLGQAPFYRWVSSGTDYNGAEISATTTYQAPDKYHIWYDDGTEIIMIGNDYYFYPDPETGGWASQTLESSDNSIEMLDDGTVSSLKSLGTKLFNGKTCNNYSFTLETSDGIEQDTLCLDPATGLPVLMTLKGEVVDLLSNFFYTFNKTTDDIQTPITEEIQ
jgi:hypothetical protein